MAGRTSRGRQRIEMKQTENEDEKLVRFSKRKSGIFKKASELATLCGSEVGVVIFSPSGKPYSFGHPSIDSIANQFLNRNQPHDSGSDILVESHRGLRIKELNEQHDELVDQVKSDTLRGKMLKRVTEGRDGEGWWEAPIEQLNLEELNQMKARVLELQRNLWRSIDQRNQGGTSIQGESSNQRNDASGQA